MPSGTERHDLKVDNDRHGVQEYYYSDTDLQENPDSLSEMPVCLDGDNADMSNETGTCIFENQGTDETMEENELNLNEPVEAECRDEDDLSEADRLNNATTEGTSNTDPHDTTSFLSSVVAAILLFAFQWQKLYGISDQGIQALIQFQKFFLRTVGTYIKINFPLNVAKSLPGTLYSMRKYIGLQRDQFIQYVACPDCHTLYHFNDCFKERNNGNKTILKCNHIIFPRHPHARKRKPCGTALLKKVCGKDGKEYVYPKKVYCYKNIIDSLQCFVKRTQFIEKCNVWKQRQSGHDILEDIYDGKVWKDFEKQGFFKTKHDFGVTLNIDWFQPYKHTPHSVGALYLVINNLPHDERNKPENVILVSILSFFW
uniref:Uncharacterized protein LOC102805845 n=1 Tax=Saccoglossus kowalevskii TaxID=10224 RepID=A0ABM0MBS7_SACKO|nr:PREDICTED: uncharacterized protein LOC102805845 [Saccoglossus kowalevskii]